jgi:iron complex outermembrane receptor protein
LNAAAFYYDFEDLQLSSYSVSAGAPIGSLRFQNAGKVELHGFEVDLLFRPVANAEFNLGYGDTDSKIKSDNLAQDVANGTNISLDGNELPFSNPSLNVGARYYIPLGGNGTLSLQANYHWMDDHYFSAENTLT